MDAKQPHPLFCPCCNLKMRNVGGIFMCVDNDCTMICGNCDLCVIRWRKLPKSARFRFTTSAGRRAASDPEKYPCIYFESATHAKIAYRLLIDATPEKRLDFFIKNPSGQQPSAASSTGIA